MLGFDFEIPRDRLVLKKITKQTPVHKPTTHI